jgi:hypothetical protein
MYARPLFHQKWELFAPDPPLCSSTLSCEPDDHYLVDRIHRNLAYHIGTFIHNKDSIPEVLHVALERSDACGSDLVIRCVIDPKQPEIRDHISIHIAE